MTPASPISLLTLTPQLILMAGACVVLLVGQGYTQSARRSVSWITLGSVVAALAAALFIFSPELAARTGWQINLSGNGLVHTNLAVYVLKSTLTLGVLMILAGWTAARESENGEFFAMLLCSLTGLLLVGPADNLVILFLALELVSVPTYVMVALSRVNQRGVEAGTKYFYLGAFSAAIMAYGFSFLYGVAGTASLSEAVRATGLALSRPGELPFILAVVGVTLSIGGLLFKLAAFPFHFYVADVYHGASSPVAGMLGFVPKIAGLVAVCKIVTATGFWDVWNVAALSQAIAAAAGDKIIDSTIGAGHVATFWLLWLVAALSMTIGNLLALMQYNVKRMLAYSGVAHAGYMLVGVLAGPGDSTWRDGTAAALFYVVVYGIANLGAFVILGLLRVRGEACETRRDLAGLMRRHPGLAVLMALAMFTLMGMPPTPGFWGKLTLFGSALAAGQTMPGDFGWWMTALVVIAVINSAIAAAYYLSVIAAVLLDTSERPAEALPREAPQMGAMLCGLLTLIFAFHPSLLMNVGRDATNEFRSIHVAAKAAPGPPRVAQAEARAASSE